MKSPIEFRTFKSFISGSFLFLIGIFQSIILVPLFLNIWGKEKYGIFLSIISFISLIKTIEIGHQIFVGNEFIKYYNTDKEYSKKILSSSFWVCILIGILEFVIFSIFLLKYSNIIWGKSNILYNSDIYLNASLLFFVFIWSLLGSIGGLLVRIILPLGIYAKTLELSILNKVSELLVLFFAVILEQKLSVVFWGLGFVNLLYSIIVFIYVKNTLPEFFPWWDSFNWKFGFRNYVKSIILTLNSFADQLNSSSIIILITRTMNVALIPVFTTIRTITNVLLQLTNLIINPLSPELIRFHANNEHDKVLQILNTNLFISSLFVNLPFLVIAPFVHYFFIIWTSNELIFDYSLYSILTLSVCFVNIGRGYITLLTSINDLINLSLISFARVSLTFFLGVILIENLGLSGIGLAILFSEFFSSFLLPLFMVSRKSYFKVKILLFQLVWINILQIILLLFYFLISIYVNNLIIPAYTVTLFLMILTSLKQWKLLDIDIRNRLWSLVPYKFTKYF